MHVKKPPRAPRATTTAKPASARHARGTSNAHTAGHGPDETAVTRAPETCTKGFESGSTKAAQRALGLIEPSTARQSGAAARAAVAGVGFLDGGFEPRVKKGVVAALVGLSLFTGLPTKQATDPFVYTPAPPVRSVLDVRALQAVGYDLPDPGLHKDELDEAGKPAYSTERFRGPLFDPGGAELVDVRQGSLGNCFVPASAGAIAFHRPGHFEKMIQKKESTDAATGTTRVWYEVTFHERVVENGKVRFKPVVQQVDGDLFVTSPGDPLYGADNRDGGVDGMELWWPILEKAYADWKGDYNTLGNGGQMSNALRDMLGVETSLLTINTAPADQVWRQIVKNVDARAPIGAGTHGKDHEAQYANTGVYAHHAYTILGYEVKRGEKYVKLRNPWGFSEPSGNGRDDGVFKLKLDDFLKLYATLYFVTGE